MYVTTKGREGEGDKNCTYISALFGWKKYYWSIKLCSKFISNSCCEKYIVCKMIIANSTIGIAHSHSLYYSVTRWCTLHSLYWIRGFWTETRVSNLFQQQQMWVWVDDTSRVVDTSFNCRCVCFYQRKVYHTWIQPSKIKPKRGVRKLRGVSNSKS